MAVFINAGGHTFNRGDFDSVAAGTNDVGLLTNSGPLVVDDFNADARPDIAVGGGTRALLGLYWGTP